MEKKVSIITLGCAKNSIDSEIIAYLLDREGVKICHDPESAPVVLINTCGFIDEAKEEAIDTIIDTGKLKKNSRLKKLVVSGCLVNRYGEKLGINMPEIDSLSSTDPHETASAVLSAFGLTSTVDAGQAYRRLRPRDSAWTYLRISDGCNNRCTYCTIPSIRGPLKSRPESEIIEEAQALSEEGVKEINVIAQDTTSYWRDAGGYPRLHVLLDRLARELTGIRIRLLYTHPAHYYTELIDVIAEREQICPYLDIPLQHVNDGVLKAMGRMITKSEIEILIKRLRNTIPGLVIRTTFIIGFPSETEAAFEELLEFAHKTRFERAGAFIYSREEGTSSARLNDPTPQEIKQDRHDRFMSLQRDIAFEMAEFRKGEIANVLIEGRYKEDNLLWAARSEHEAPEVDPLILVKDSKTLKPGDIIKVKITDSRGYDCIATPLAYRQDF